MTHVNGTLNLETLSRLAGAGEIETVVVGFTDLYGRLMGKRFDAIHFLEHVAGRGTHACDYLLTVDMEMEPVAGYTFANWETGYGDMHLVADLSTLRIASWLQRSALVLCDVHRQPDGQPAPPAPRNMLRTQVACLHEAGFTTRAASELEYYVFRESYRELAQRRYREASSAGWYIEDYHLLQGARLEDYHGAVRYHLGRSGIPVESTKGEWGKGQHELNIRCADVTSMSDRHVLQKQCMKEVADRMGLSVTFMAKFDEAQAGSSCHVHLSLWQGDENAFAGDELLGPVRCSNCFRHFLAGWMAYVPEMMVFYAPTVNSYKRYQAGSWAPTRLAWSHDNRTAGFRVVGSGQSLRIEARIPGADCNPYLVYAAALASGLEGIRQQMEPPELFRGDAYRADAPRVPATLREATERFSRGELARAAFGDDVVEHYTHFFRTEQAGFDQAVTDWERMRYFERI